MVSYQFVKEFTTARRRYCDKSMESAKLLRRSQHAENFFTAAPKSG
jgi:hypothetical protein